QEHDIGFETAPDYVDRSEEGVLVQLAAEATEPTVGHRRPPPAVEDDPPRAARLRQRREVLCMAGEVEQLPSQRRGDLLLLGRLVDGLGEVRQTGGHMGDQRSGLVPAGGFESVPLSGLARLVQALKNNERAGSESHGRSLLGWSGNLSRWRAMG